MHSNKKGISFQIILMIIAIAAGAVTLLILASISEGAVSNADYGCLIGNTFKNMMGDVQYDSGSGYCKVELSTIRAPDFSSNNLFKNCKAIMLDQNNFELSIDDAYINPKETIEKCVAYQVMNEVEECWSNYLLGEAQFNGQCDRICFADGFSSYVLEDRSGTTIIPNIKNAELYFFPGTFNSEKIDVRLLGGLIPFSEVSSQYGNSIKLTKQTEGNKIKIEYEKSLGSRSVFSIVQRIPTRANKSAFDDALFLIESDPDRVGLDGGYYRTESNEGIDSGEEWEINYHEPADFHVATAVGVIGGSKFGKGAAIAGGYVGTQIDNFIGTEWKGSFIDIEKRGMC